MRQLPGWGYTDVWTAETNGTDAFVPLALVAAWEPSLRLGTAIVPVFTRGPALIAMSAATMAAAAPGRFVLGLGASSPAIVTAWNGLEFAEPYRRTRDVLRMVRAALAGERVDGAFDTFRIRRFRLDNPPAEPPPVMLAALRPQMLRLAGREADGAILNWLAASDVPRCLEAIGTPTQTVARIFVCPTEDAEHARRLGRRLICAYLTVPAYAAFHDWLGRGAALRGMHEAWAAGDRAGAGRRDPRRGRRRAGAARRARVGARAGAGLRRRRRRHAGDRAAADARRRGRRPGAAARAGRLMRLSGAVAVVTGAASGIGAALAARFAAEGARVVGVDREDGDGVVAAATSPTPPRSPRWWSAVVGDHGRIDLFCSNAGITTGVGLDDPADLLARGPSRSTSWRTCTPRAPCRAAHARAGRGYLLNTASAAGLLTSPGDAPYAVTKHGAVGFAEWLAVTYGGRGIGGQRALPDGRGHPVADGPARRRRARRAGGRGLGGDRHRRARRRGGGRRARQAETFLILPHPQVGTFWAQKASDPDRWLAGMRRLLDR